MEPVPPGRPSEQSQLKALYSGGLMGGTECPLGTAVSFLCKHTPEDGFPKRCQCPLLRPHKQKVLWSCSFWLAVSAEDVLQALVLGG